jgi:maleylpyruvate isomerase
MTDHDASGMTDHDASDMTDRVFDPVLLNRRVEGLAESHQSLLADLESLTDDLVKRPSLLPSWTVGHVLAHLEQQARSVTRLVDGAERGEVVDQYPGGLAARAEAIERLSTRTAGEHVRSVRDSIYELEGTLARAREAWFGYGRMVSGIDVPVTDLPLRRRREVEVHAGDLGIGDWGPVGPDRWADDYVRDDLSVLTMQWKARGSMGLTDLPSPVATRPPRERLAWLLGRRDIDGVAPAGLIS